MIWFLVPKAFWIEDQDLMFEFWNLIFGYCNKDNFIIFVAGKPFYRCFARKRGKSGQRRVTYFLTGRRSKGFSSRAENNRQSYFGNFGKGEKVR